MYILTSLNHPNRQPVLRDKKNQSSSTAANNSPKSGTGAKSAPLFSGRNDVPIYTSDDYEFLGLKKLSIAHEIKDEIEDDLSDVEYYKKQAKEEKEIAKEKKRLSRKLEHKAKNSLFHKDKYRREALQRKQSMFLHEDKATLAATRSQIARQEAQKKKEESEDLLKEGRTLLDYADQLKPRVYPSSGNRYAEQEPTDSEYSGHYGGASAHASGAASYRRGTFSFNPMPDTIFEEDEPTFAPPPKPSRSQSYSEQSRFAPPPMPSRSQSYSEKSRFAPQPPDNFSDYYEYVEPETQSRPQKRYEKPSGNPFSKNKSYTVPGAYPEYPSFTEEPDSFQSQPSAPKAQPRHFDSRRQYPSDAGPSNSQRYRYSGKPYPKDFKPGEYSERNDGPKIHTRAKTRPAAPADAPKPADSPPAPETYRHPNEANFKYEQWMPKSWKLFADKAPTAIQDVYETKELGQLFSTVVQKIIKPEDIKFVTSEENGVKTTRVRLKTSNEVFRDWKVKTHADKAGERDVKIFKALGVLFDKGENAVFEFDDKGQAIQIQRR